MRVKTVMATCCVVSTIGCAAALWNRSYRLPVGQALSIASRADAINRARRNRGWRRRR